MLKATLRGAVLLGLLALTVPAFAEVQNVKVGGDITVRSFYRSDLSLTGKGHTGTTGQGKHEDFLTSTTGVNIGADLTENVSAFLRLANERDWNLDNATTTTYAGSYTTGASSNDVAISQSYITLKELFYSPLTVRLGKQPIVWGRGFVLGSNLLPSVVSRGDDLHAAIRANEFTDFTAFDAIRATLDLAGVGGIGVPLNVDYVYIKLNEANPANADDTNLQGVNFGTHFDVASSEIETYFLNKSDNQKTNGKNGSVNTTGVRGSAKPISGAYTYGELAYQFGKRATDLNGAALPSGDAQQAWAFDLGTDYTAKEIPWTPKLGAEWIFWSGKDIGGNAQSGWDPIARGYFTTALREFQTASGVGGFYANAQTTATSAATNEHQFSVYGSLKPLEDLTIAPRLTWFVADVGIKQPAGGNVPRHSFIGTEWDTQVTYNYTDDVQLGVIYGVFAPGSVYRAPNDAVSQELVSSVSVKF